jgi:hypothetical protein
MTPGRDSVERIRRHELSRALKKVNVSSEEAGIIDLLSRSLVGKLLDGPISEVLVRAEAETPFKGRPDSEASCELEKYGGADKPPGSKSGYQIRRNGKPYIECEFESGSDRVSSKPARSDGESGGTGARAISA